MNTLILIINRLCLLAAFAALLTACKTAQPVAPAAAYGPSFERVKEVSVFNLPVEIPASDLEKLVNANLPQLIYEDKSLDDNGGDNLMLKVTRRGPLKLEVKTGYFNYTVPVHIWAKAGWKIEKLGITLSKYEETSFDIDIRFATKVAVDSRWTVTTQTAGNGFDWISKPFVTIGGFKIPITTIIDRIITEQQPGLAKNIDDAAKGKLNLKPYLTDACRQLRNPILLNPDYKISLKVTPLELGYTGFGPAQGRIRSQISLKAYTETYVGNITPSLADTLLPPLKTNIKPDEQTRIGLIARIGFKEARDIAFKQVEGKTYEFQGGKKSIQITDMEVYGQNDQIIVMLKTAGSYQGTVWLRGKPVWDNKVQSLKLTNLDFDLDTKNKLLRSTNWLFHGVLLEKMEPYFNVSMAAQLTEAKKLIAQNLSMNRLNDKITLNGKLTDLSPDGVYVSPAGIMAVIIATGKLEVLVSGL